MEHKIISNYKSKTYTLKESKMKYLKNDYQGVSKDEFEQKLDDLLLDIESVLK